MGLRSIAIAVFTRTSVAERERVRQGIGRALNEQRSPADRATQELWRLRRRSSELHPNNWVFEDG
jgi:hypothetical protein